MEAQKSNQVNESNVTLCVVTDKFSVSSRSDSHKSQASAGAAASISTPGDLQPEHGGSLSDQCPSSSTAGGFSPESDPGTNAIRRTSCTSSVAKLGGSDTCIPSPFSSRCVPDDREQECSPSGPVGEGAERVHPLPSANLHQDVEVSPTQEFNFDSAQRRPSQWSSIIHDWFLPSNPDYEELCQDLDERSLGFLHTDTPFRRFCIYTVKSKPFEYLCMSMILLNCIFLAMDSNNPDHQATVLGKVLQSAEWVFMVAFSVEMVLKIFGLGLYGARGAYLRDGWNVVDCMVVVVGWLSLLPSVDNISAMRTVRVLRPLRTITGVAGMRLLVSTLLRALPMLLDVLILVAFLFLIFGTVGVQVFAGVLRQHCGVPAGGILNGTLMSNVTQFVVLDSDEVCGTNIIDLQDTVGWFDSNGLTIFQCVSLEGWTDVMYAVQDGRDYLVAIYFIVLIVVGAFFTVNLALAVLYLQFTNSQLENEVEREEAEAAARAAGSVAETGPNSDEATVRNSLHPVPPVIAEETSQAGFSNLFHVLSTIHKFCQRIAPLPEFEALTLVLITINTLIMASEYHGMTGWHTQVVSAANVLLTLYFALEMLIKIIGLGVKGYLSDRINIFDGSIVASSLAEVIVFLCGGGRGTLSVFRAFRLMRVFKLARRWEELNKIVQTIFKSLSSIAYLSLLLLLFVFIMALLGMQIFGYKFTFCNVPGSQPICPKGMKASDGCLLSDGCYTCPAHRDCYIPCSESTWGSWIEAPGSPYNDKAFCERFPRLTEELAPEENEWEYLAQTGKSHVARHNFDNIFWSFITIFQILTGENWNTVMYDGMRTTNSQAALYFLFIVVIGNYVVLNLFLAILLEQFSAGDENNRLTSEIRELSEQNQAREESSPEQISVKRDLGKEAGKQRHFWPLHEALTPDAWVRRDDRNFWSMLSNALSFEQSSHEALELDDVSSTLHGYSLFVFGPKHPLRIFLALIVRHVLFEQLIIALIIMSSIVLAIDSPSLDPDGALKAALEMIDFILTILFIMEAVAKIIVYGWVLSPDAYIRSPWNVLDFLAVVVGVLLLGIDDKKGSFTSLKSLRTLRALRPIRMASRWPGMKVVVNALFQSIPASGNVLLVCALFYIIFGIMFVSLLKGTFGRCQSGDTRLDPDYYAHTTEGGITQQWCLMGSHEIKASTSYYHSQIPPSALPAVHELENGNTFTLEHQWTEAEANFNNIINALVALFEIATTEMWPDYMYQAIDATHPGEQPILQNRPANALYFVLFIIVGSFFVLNLFVGVVIDKFNEMQAEYIGQNLLLTPAQEQWVTIQRLMASAKPPRTHERPDNIYQAAVFEVVVSDTFERAIIAIILLNIACLAMTYVGMPQDLITALFWLNVIFTIIFILEVIFKLIGLGWKQYFSDRWCIFDCCVAFLSLVQIGIDVFLDNDIQAVNLLRVFRVARIFRLVPKDTENCASNDTKSAFILTGTCSKPYLPMTENIDLLSYTLQAKGLRTLLQTLLFSLPALVNVASVFFLFMFIFAIMGMNLFGNTKYGEYLNRHANFDSFVPAILVLMRVSTGESWNGIMRDCMIKKECISVVKPFTNQAGVFVASTAESGTWYNPGSEVLIGAPSDAYVNRCGAWSFLVVSYFIVFVIMCGFLLLNLVIAVILDNFQNSSTNEELEVSQSNVLNFAEMWGKLDPRTTLFIPASQLTKLIESVDPPLGTRGVQNAQVEVQNIIMDTEIPIRNVNDTPHVQFAEVMHALGGRVAGCRVPLADEVKARSRFTHLLPTRSLESAKYGAAHYCAALHVQAAVRGFLARHDMESMNSLARSTKEAVGDNREESDNAQSVRS